MMNNTYSTFIQHSTFQHLFKIRENTRAWNCVLIFMKTSSTESWKNVRKEIFNLFFYRSFPSVALRLDVIYLGRKEPNGLISKKPKTVPMSFANEPRRLTAKLYLYIFSKDERFQEHGWPFTRVFWGFEKSHIGSIIYSSMPCSTYARYSFLAFHSFGTAKFRRAALVTKKTG